MRISSSAIDTMRCLAPARLLAAALAAATALAVAPATPVLASTWCGENGLVRFSFAPVDVDTVLPVLVTGEPQGGVTVVDVTAWLTGVAPLARKGDAFLRVGGLEMRLAITGAEASILAQDFADPRALNVGPAPGDVAAGFHPGLRIRDGAVRLAHWKVLFKGSPRDVRFGLDTAPLRSCATMEGCPGSGSPALYTGADAANQLDYIFGAGYVPSWLNPTGVPDATPVTGKVTWRDRGVFEAREP